MNYSEELEYIQNSSLVQTVGLLVFIAYAAIVLFGVPSNFYVLYRLCKLARDDNEKYISGSGAGLFAMATADLLSIFSISLQHMLAFITARSSELINNLLCKVLIFTTHTATSVSIWSWLMLSTLRYLAIHHPFLHLRLYRVPYRAIIICVIVCSAINFWLLIAVYHEPNGCVQHLFIFPDGRLNRWFLLIDCVWSFCIPFSVIVCLDTFLLFRRTREKQARQEELQLHKATRKPRKMQSGLRKFLIIAFIDLLLNTPENLYRLATLLYFPVIVPNKYNFSARMIAQMLYFSQFAFNSVYLALFVYDKNIRPRLTSCSSNRSVDMRALITSRRALKQHEDADSCGAAAQRTSANV